MPANAINKTNKQASSHALDRQWKILAQLSARKWLGTRDIEHRLKLQGVHIGLRTIQRDLNQLAERFPIECDNSVPQGWRWQQGADLSSFAMMNSSQALTFVMVEAHLAGLLPNTLLAELKPWFTQAKQSLGADNKLTDWMEHVRVLPSTQPLHPPNVNQAAQAQIYEALLEQQQLHLLYSKRGSSEVSEYTLHPMAIVHKDAAIYLLAMRDDQPDVVRQFALHRVQQATMLVKNSLPAGHFGFNLERYIEEGHFGYHLAVLGNNPGKQLVTLTFANSLAATRVLEAPLCPQQRHKLHRDGRVQIQAQLVVTQQLGWWLRGFGKQLLAVAPAELSHFVFEQ